MAFKDYYSILQIDIDVSESVIRAAFKQQALRWHPDRNKGIDTTTKMQAINEAYLILKDVEARARYDVQYRLFKEQVDTNYPSTQAKETYTKSDSFTFETSDEILKRWMETAQKQSVSLARQLTLELRSTSKRALAGAGEAAFDVIKFYIPFFALVFLFIFLLKSCH